MNGVGGWLHPSGMKFAMLPEQFLFCSKETP